MALLTGSQHAEEAIAISNELILGDIKESGNLCLTRKEAAEFLGVTIDTPEREDDIITACDRLPEQKSSAALFSGKVIPCFESYLHTAAYQCHIRRLHLRYGL